jgi:exocyst complex component 8
VLLTFFHIQRNSMTFHPDKMPLLPDWMAELARRAGIDGDTSARDKSERDARFVSDLSDDLTVELVEGRAKVTSIPSLSTRLTPLTASLTSALLDALSAPNRHYQRMYLEQPLRARQAQKPVDIFT